MRDLIGVLEQKIANIAKGQPRVNLETKMSQLDEQMTMLSQRMKEESKDTQDGCKVEDIVQRMAQIESDVKAIPSLSDIVQKDEKNKKADKNHFEQLQLRMKSLEENLKRECIKLSANFLNSLV